MVERCCAYIRYYNSNNYNNRCTRLIPENFKKTPFCRKHRFFHFSQNEYNKYLNSENENAIRICQYKYYSGKYRGLMCSRILNKEEGLSYCNYHQKKVHGFCNYRLFINDYHIRCQNISANKGLIKTKHGYCKNHQNTPNCVSLCDEDTDIKKSMIILPIDIILYIYSFSGVHQRYVLRCTSKIFLKFDFFNFKYSNNIIKKNNLGTINSSDFHFIISGILSYINRSKIENNEKINKMHDMYKFFIKYKENLYKNPELFLAAKNKLYEIIDQGMEEFNIYISFFS